MTGEKGLKSCPFCGMDNPDWCDDEIGSITWFYIQCRSSDCQANGPMEQTKDGAIAAWNKRI